MKEKMIEGLLFHTNFFNYHFYRIPASEYSLIKETCSSIKLLFFITFDLGERLVEKKK
jgi:hypothetical protein